MGQFYEEAFNILMLKGESYLFKLFFLKHIFVELVSLTQLKFKRCIFWLKTLTLFNRTN